MSVNTELQNLLTKMGGSPLESDSNSDLIKKISEAYDGSGSGGGSSGGCNCLTAHVTASEDDTNSYYTLDKTWREIFDASQVNIIREVSPAEKNYWIIIEVEKVNDNIYNVVADDAANDFSTRIMTCATENSYPTQTLPKENTDQ